MGGDQDLPRQNVWSKEFEVGNRRIDGGCEETKNGHRPRLALRPICTVRLSSSTCTGIVPTSGNRICFDLRTSGHLYADRKDGLHSSGGGGRVGAVLDCREGQDGAAKCEKKGKKIGPPAHSAVECGRDCESETRQSNGTLQSETICGTL